MQLRRLITFLVIFSLCSITAFAADVIEEKKPAIGIHGLYTFVPDAFTDISYSEHTSISAVGYGLWTTYGFGAYDMMLRVNNWHLFIGDGYWKPRNGDDEDRFYVESDLGLVDLDMSILWKWRVHEAVEPYVGPTLGIGFFYGDVTVDEMGPLGEHRQNDPQNKEIPPVIPLAGFQGGCRFYPDPHFRISVDLGFFNGFFAGLGIGYAF